MGGDGGMTLRETDCPYCGEVKGSTGWVELQGAQLVEVRTLLRLPANATHEQVCQLLHRMTRVPLPERYAPGQNSGGCPHKTEGESGG